MGLRRFDGNGVGFGIGVGCGFGIGYGFGGAPIGFAGLGVGGGCGVGIGLGWGFGSALGSEYIDVRLSSCFSTCPSVPISTSRRLSSPFMVLDLLYFALSMP